jgi:hypothetical protein
MWKYNDKDPTYFEDRAVRAAVADISRIAGARQSRSCARPSPGP